MLGERIRILRTKAQMTQKELAQQLDTSVSAIGMYEQGRREPPHRTLVRLGEVFGVSTDWLLSGAQTSAAAKERVYDVDAALEEFLDMLSQAQQLTYRGDVLTAAQSRRVKDAMRLGLQLALRIE